MLDETSNVIEDLYNKWIVPPQKEIEYLKSQLRIACKYLKEAKVKLAIHTTNSDVDDFIRKWEEE